MTKFLCICFRRRAAADFSRGFLTLVITQIFARNVRFGFQPAKSGDSIKPRVERVACVTLGTLAKIHLAREGGRQRVVNHLSISVAHFVGLLIPFDAFLGFRLRLHPRLYAIVRLRGLRSCTDLGNDKG